MTLGALLRCATLTAALVLTATACSGDDDVPGAEATGGTLELAPSTTTTTPPETAVLLDLLLDELPLTGFVPADDAVGTGPLDLEAAAAAEEDVDGERARLEARRFERGASRAWLDPQQAVAYVAVYAFATAEDAEAYLAGSAGRLAERGATGFEVPDVAGAIGLTTVEEAAGGTFTTHAVAFTSGERWVLVLVGSPASGPTPEDAITLATAQAARVR